MSNHLRTLPIAPLPTSTAVSATMRGNRSKNTRPELAVRRLLFRLGYRYRLHRRDIPGCPDIVFLRRRRLIFVNGCFWHQHASNHCPLRTHPRSHADYWRPKLQINKQRDITNRRKLLKMRWRISTVWECEIHDTSGLAEKLERFLGPTKISKKSLS
jgi:DNA mismatch endonuclease (patch repair protein)